ncbi:MAG: hypothetical protein Q9208_001214 [Pyrenodesmia sp. 3 TL-2023]
MAHTASLQAKLAATLPLNRHLTLHHLSTPPTPCPALYSAPPGQKPEKTYSESHFLSVSITLPPPQKQIQILALEVLIYTTAHLTTIFVAKADSTGYLYLLHLPKGTPSPLKTITSTFLSHLVAHRQRKDRKLVVSLFARAQDQYLFPGSVENPHKHVLDDRGLVRWWCRVLEPVLHAGSTWDSSSSSSSSHHRERKSTTSAYLRVPGCDIHETRSFFPLSVRLTPTTNLAPKWHPSRDPLRDLIRSPTIPERCLIPRFPDDPKSRFVDELDEELTEPAPPPESSSQQVKESPSKGKRPGRWRSVTGLEQFWELMAFRQECSSGRLVGFLWGVFEPEGMHHSLGGGGKREGSPSRKSTYSQDRMEVRLTRSSQQQRTFSSSPSSKTSQTQQRPEKTAHYFWPPSTRGAIVLPPKHYDRVNKLLLHLDYATVEVAAESTKRWIEDVAMCAGRKEGWGIEVVGEMPLPVLDGADGGQGWGGEAGGGVNVLAAGMMRKKKRVGDGEGGGVQVLSAGLVRKKPKLK